MTTVSTLCLNDTQTSTVPQILTTRGLLLQESFFILMRERNRLNPLDHKVKPLNSETQTRLSCRNEINFSNKVSSLKKNSFVTRGEGQPTTTSTSIFHLEFGQTRKYKARRQLRHQHQRKKTLSLSPLMKKVNTIIWKNYHLRASFCTLKSQYNKQES